MPIARRHLNPPSLFSPEGLGFTQIVTSSPGVTVHISGQVAWDAERRIVGGTDLRLQAEQSFRNLKNALEAAGASLADVVFLRLYVVNYRPEYAAILCPILAAFFHGVSFPATTWIGVQALAVPDFLIEIEATAVISA